MENIERPVSRQPIPAHASIVHRGPLFEVWQWQQEMFNGKQKTFEKLRRPDTVLILPISNDKAFFIEEQQPGTGKMLRTIGGRVNSDEKPMVAASRELKEETGYESKNLVLWHAWQPVNKIDWAVYLFIAQDVRRIHKQDIDEGELITLKEIPVRELFDPKKSLNLDDNEFLSQLYFARGDEEENKRIKKILGI